MYGNVIPVTVLKRLNYALALLLICLQLCQHALVLETVQDFLIKVDIKPQMHLLEISIFH